MAIITACFYIYFEQKAEKREAVESKTNHFIAQVLKGRISVYQFLRAPSEDGATKVRTDFKDLENQVKMLIPTLSLKENIQLANEIVELTQKYVSSFNTFYSQKISEFNNGNIKESPEVAALIKEMVQVGVKLEEKLAQINESAINLKWEAESDMTLTLIIISILAVTLFVIISILLSNQIIQSINNFQNGLLSFFSYVNKESSTVEVLA